MRLTVLVSSSNNSLSSAGYVALYWSNTFDKRIHQPAHLCGISLAVKFLLAMQRSRVRLPYPTPCTKALAAIHFNVFWVLTSLDVEQVVQPIK